MKEIYLFFNGVMIHCNEISVNSHDKNFLVLLSNGRTVGSLDLKKIRFVFFDSDDKSKSYNLVSIIK